MSLYEVFVTIVLSIAMHWTVQSLAALVLADVLTGLASAWRRQVFDPKRSADFLANTIGPYILCYLAVRLVLLALPDWEPVSLIIWALIVIALSASIGQNLQEVFGRKIPVPSPPEPPGG